MGREMLPLSTIIKSEMVYALENSKSIKFDGPHGTPTDMLLHKNEKNKMVWLNFQILFENSHIPHLPQT